MQYPPPQKNTRSSQLRKDLIIDDKVLFLIILLGKTCGDIDYYRCGQKWHYSNECPQDRKHRYLCNEEEPCYQDESEYYSEHIKKEQPYVEHEI